MGRVRAQRDKTTGRFLPGNAASMRHGGFTSNAKDIPLAVRRQVAAIRAGLIDDIAGEESKLTAAQRCLIEKTVNLYQITLAIESFVNANGAFRGRKLDPVLGETYVKYVNLLRLNLKELGLVSRAARETPTLVEYMEIVGQGEKGPDLAPGARQDAPEREKSPGEGEESGGEELA